MNKAAESLLDKKEVADLLILCEEVVRATPDGTKRFIEPSAGFLDRTKSKQHNMVFGRRGSGKSSLLRRAANDLTLDRRPVSFVDMETFKGHTYPDVLISVLIKSLKEFEYWLESAATAPASRKTFWQKLFNGLPLRPPFKKNETLELKEELRGFISNLENQLLRPQSAKSVKTSSAEKEGGLQVGVPSSLLGIDVDATLKASKSEVLMEEYTSHKIEYLYQNIMSFQDFFKKLSRLSDGPSYLILDDLYHIRKTDQPKVIDYFHRIGKGNDLWIKIGTIKHRSEWYHHSDPPIGVKLGDDAKEINLDISLEKYIALKTFLRKILNGLLNESNIPNEKALINPTAVDRLIVASGGVARDFVGIFSAAISQAQNRDAGNHRGPRISAEDVNLGAGDYAPNKDEEFKVDAKDDRVILEAEFNKIVDFCTKTSKCNVFLVSQSLEGSARFSIDQLIDLRLIHLVKSRVTLKAGAIGEVFEAYMLDVSRYTASRKVRGFTMIDLSSTSKDEEIRKSSLIYPPS